MSKTKTSRELYAQLLDTFKAPQRVTRIEKTVSRTVEENGFSNSTASKLKSKLLDSGIREVKLKWPNTPPQARLYSSADPDEIHPVEVALGIWDDGYLCYQTALYWNELTEQVPTTLFLAKERPSSSTPSPAPERWDDLSLRDTFMKGPIEHKRVAVFENHKIVLLERAYTNRAGVVRREMSWGGGTHSVPITDLERTLLDCASVPEDAGGVSNVIDAFENATGRLNIDKLVETYAALGFKYPHWQRIGFLLQHFVDPAMALRWSSAFGKPKLKFYLAKGYRADWLFDERYALYYPPGILK